MLVGWANGVLIGRFRILPFIVNLGMLYMIAGAAMVYSGGSSLFGLPQPDAKSRLSAKIAWRSLGFELEMMVLGFADLGLLG